MFVSTEQKGQSALLLAAKAGRANCLQVLLSLEPPPNVLLKDAVGDALRRFQIRICILIPLCMPLCRRRVRVWLVYYSRPRQAVSNEVAVGM